jgi:uncharacterized paraquat-inducible protein A
MYNRALADDRLVVCPDCDLPQRLPESVPMLGLTAVGHAASTTVLGGAQQLWQDGREMVAVLVLFTAVIAPALQISFLLAIVGQRRRHRDPRSRTGIAGALR